MITYNMEGYKYDVVKDITKNEFYDMFLKLNDEFEEYEFTPNLAVEGGIEFKCKQGHIKEIRFYISNTKGNIPNFITGLLTIKGKWEDCRNSNDIVLKKGQYIKTWK